MIARFEFLIRRLSRMLSPYEWPAAFRRRGPPAISPGLLVIGIDGRSGVEFEEALARGAMPFCRRLLEREFTVVRVLSPSPSGRLPQDELFDGLRGLLGPRESGRSPRRAAPAVLKARLEMSGGVPALWVDLPCPSGARALRSIDKNIRALWRSARKSGRRDYDVWVVFGSGGGARAFALTSVDTLPASGAATVPVSELVLAAFFRLGRANPSGAAAIRRRPRASRVMRVMTYNVHSCVGMDGFYSAERIARVIARHQPDVAALQELDVGRRRTGGDNQARLIAALTGMDVAFHPVFRRENESYGDAVLSALPFLKVRTGVLPGAENKYREPRGIVCAAVSFGGAEVRVINTHLGLFPDERLKQADALLDDEWVSAQGGGPALIVCGDFNAGPGGRAYKRMAGRLRDAQSAAGVRPSRTFSSRWPLARIDHIFVGPGVDVLDVRVPRSALELAASDHLPVVADLRIPTAPAGSAARERPP